MSELLKENPLVEIDGTKYEMRRLGPRDLFKLTRILAQGAASLGSELNNMQLTAESIAMLVVAGLPYSEEQAISLFADLIGIEKEDFDKMPMDAILDIGAKLVEHQDLKAFFDKFKKLLENPGMKDFLNKQSTSSKKGTAGRTKKS